MTVAIFGGAGQLGSRLVKRLRDQGVGVRALSRDPAGRCRELREQGAEVRFADLTDPATLPAAVAGANEVVYSAHALAPPSRHNNPESVDGEGFRKLVDVAAENRVQHFLFVSATIAAQDSPARFGRIKFAAEQYLAESGIPFTVVRPSAFIECHGIQMLAEPLWRKRTPVLVGNEPTVMNWLAADDCADFLVERLQSSAENKTFSIGGVDNLSRRAVVALAAEALGCEPRIRRIPLAAMRIMGRLSARVHTGFSVLADLAVAEEEHGSFFGWQPSEGQDAVGRTTVQRVLERWVSDQPSGLK